jgi:hypothetical protein
MEQLEQTGVHEFLEHTAGSGYTKAGIEVGDQLYIVNFLDGMLSVLGRMTVGEFLDRAGATARFGDDVYDAREHIVAVQDSATPKVFDALVYDELIDDLEFLNKGGEILRAKRNASGQVEPQTFTNVREITRSTGALFDLLLGFRADESFDAGGSVQRLVDFAFTVRDDDGNETDLATLLLTQAEAVLPRVVDLGTVSIADRSVISDPDRLAPVLWQAIERWSSQHNAAVLDRGVPFSQMVRESLEDSGLDDE